MSSPRSETIEELHELGIIINRREIFLGKESGPDGDDTDYKSAMKFIKNMRLLQQFGGGKDNPIVVHQMNDGGEWCAGMAIFDAIASSESHVTIVCHGSAMSMGSIIPQAADLRIMMPNSVFMIHGGSTDVSDVMTYKQGQSWAAFETNTMNKMLDIYAGVCQQGKLFKGKSVGIIKNSLRKRLDAKEDWIINARDAVEHGFADAVLGDPGYSTLNEILNKR